MQFIGAVPPRSTGPGLGPAHAFFLDARHGYVATTGGAWYVPKTGIQPPVVPAEIDVTRDSGRTWRVLHREPHAAFDAIAFSGRRGYALGAHVRGRSLRTFALATSDGGRTWRRLAAPFPASAAQYPTPGAFPLALQAFGATVYVELGARTRRSVDGGATWTAVSVPRGSSVVRFTTAEIGYAGAPARCGDSLWRTTDGGATWRIVPRTCGPAYTDIDTRGPLPAAAQAEGGDTAVRSVVRVSADAGRTWIVAADTRHWPSVVRVHFMDRAHGWAFSSQDEQGFVHTALHVTADGGRTWRRRAAPFTAHDEFAPAPHELAFAGRIVWSGMSNDGLLWRSATGGRTWTVSSRPQWTLLDRVAATTGRTVVVETDLGTLRSDDGGRSWRAIRPLNARAAAVIGRSRTFVAPTNEFYSSAAFLRSRAGWRRLRPPPAARGVAAVSFVDADHGTLVSGDPDGYGRVPLFVTSDAGRTWRAVRVPRGVHVDDHAVIGPGVIALVETPTLYVSLDDGAHWQRVRVPRSTYDCTVARFGDGVWLACRGLATGPSAAILHSGDGGRSWSIFRSRVGLEATPVGPAEAWAVIGWGPWRHALWHSRDGGRTWRARWPSISPDARVPVGSR